MSSHNKPEKMTKSAEISPTRQWLKTLDEKADIIPERILRFSSTKGNKGGKCWSACLTGCTEWQFDSIEHRTLPKTTLRTSVNDLSAHIPPEMIPGIKAHRYYSRPSNTIVTHSEKERQSSDNRVDCLKKQTAMLREIANEVVRKEGRDKAAQRSIHNFRFTLALLLFFSTVV